MKGIRKLRFMLLVMLLIVMFPSAAMAGSEKTGELTNASGTYTVTGTWKKKGSKTYFITDDVSKVRGWLQIGTKVYYLKGKGWRVTGQATIGGESYYFNKKGVLQSDVNLALTNRFDSNGEFFDSTGHQIQKSTIRNLLQVALQPVGSTMYVWGGGWNTSETTTMGVSSAWKSFFEQQSSSYNYRNTRYQKHNGLDCSGYVGWVLYNTFNTESGHGSFVMLAQRMAKTYAGWGWGKYTSAGRMKHKAGDIMSLSAGHVYIVIGECSDGSVVLVHASPKGVMINGTYSKKGKKKSQAWKLAKKYMSTYYPEWYDKYPDVSRGTSYLTRYSKMSWYIGKTNSVMSDPEGLRSMSAEEVLKVIFGEV